MVAQVFGGGAPSCAGRLTTTDVRDLMPLGQSLHQVQRAQPLAGSRRIGDVAVDDDRVHSQ